MFLAASNMFGWYYAASCSNGSRSGQNGITLCWGFTSSPWHMRRWHLWHLFWASCCVSYVIVCIFYMLMLAQIPAGASLELSMLHCGKGHSCVCRHTSRVARHWCGGVTVIPTWASVWFLQFPKQPLDDS